MEYSGHDAGRLLKRWESLAGSKGWTTHVLGEAGGYPVFALLNERAAAGEAGGLYVSAGVHGDECAPPWALLQWAEAGPAVLDELPVVLIPCFNPVGLSDNTRVNEEGIDLNRNFQNRDLPLIASWQSLLHEKKFTFALNLHEDYDATGIYLYEIADDGSPGDEILSACQDIIPRETAPSVDGSEFENGLLIHDPEAENLHQIVEEDLGGGMPEAIYLYLNHARNSFTFETPSEMDKLRRIAAHERFLEAVSGYLRNG
ncbi:MAG: M14 family metallocarboxypeptidase [Verrucomicrobiales bacterium]|nr:M14 family metallocarboxypeptidase [Verrucomicrobiales bacterium]